MQVKAHSIELGHPVLHSRCWHEFKYLWVKFDLIDCFFLGFFFPACSHLGRHVDIVNKDSEQTDEESEVQEERD